MNTNWDLFLNAKIALFAGQANKANQQKLVTQDITQEILERRIQKCEDILHAIKQEINGRVHIEDVQQHTYNTGDLLNMNTELLHTHSCFKRDLVLLSEAQKPNA